MAVWFSKTTPVEKELERVARAERRLQRQAGQHHGSPWKETLEEKLPEQVRRGLQGAFCKAFALVFEKGGFLVEKASRPETLEKEYQIYNFAVRLKGGRKELRAMRRNAGRGHFTNLAASAVEGAGLGLLGIGLPDLALFLFVILKGVYETAARYGFGYDTPGERMFILLLLEASMQKGREWERCNREVDRFLTCWPEVSEPMLKEQLERTADAFAGDMLLAKFVQGLPVAGIVGGLSNPVYYHRILRYVQLKYWKRYLCQQSGAFGSGGR